MGWADKGGGAWGVSFPTCLIGNPGYFFFKIIYAGFRPRATSHFCFGKSDQNHFRPCAAPPIPLRSSLSGVPPPPSRIGWLRNSLRSNSLRQNVDSGLRLRRTRRRGCPNEKDPSIYGTGLLTCPTIFQMNLVRGLVF